MKGTIGCRNLGTNQFEFASLFLRDFRPVVTMTRVALLAVFAALVIGSALGLEEEVAGTAAPPSDVIELAAPYFWDEVKNNGPWLLELLRIICLFHYFH